MLRREVGLPGAVMMGLGSIVGTGVFVSIGIGADIAGPAVLLAIFLAAAVATANGLSSAQLAASHPVSGGTYEYGYRYLNPTLGFTAGWVFLLAKSASAATAALGFAGYLLNLFGIHSRPMLVILALAAVAVLAFVILGGIRRSNRANTTIVSVTLVALLAFVLAGLPSAWQGMTANMIPFFAPQAGAGPWQALLHATALMFVAYTGYGRIATLGEEVREPGRTIPRAIIVTLVVSMLLYLAVGMVALATVGADTFATLTAATAAPLEAVARGFGIPGLGFLLALGAVTAMLGVLLNLILGLSRVLLAMGRRHDMPPVVARVNLATSTPATAVIAVSMVIGLLVLVGDIRITWTFSAFTVLVYYAITNLAGLRMPAAQRIFPSWIAASGLAACLFLAFWVEPSIWAIGLGLIAVGLAWRKVMQSVAVHGWRSERSD